MSLPVSSQDMLKSTKTARVRDVMMEGDTTFLWMPSINNKTEKDVEKNLYTKEIYGKEHINRMVVMFITWSVKSVNMILPLYTRIIK